MDCTKLREGGRLLPYISTRQYLFKWIVSGARRQESGASPDQGTPSHSILASNRHRPRTRPFNRDFSLVLVVVVAVRPRLGIKPVCQDGAGMTTPECPRPDGRRGMRFGPLQRATSSSHVMCTHSSLCDFRVSKLRVVVFTVAFPDSFMASLSSGPPGAEEFLSLMHRWAAFCGIRIVDYVLMANHFHLV
jgi:hypothetical protein